MIRVDVVYSLLLNEDQTKLLVVKNLGRDSWSLPGGAVEPGETLEQAAIREAWEETGYEIRVHGLMAVNECKMSQVQEQVLFFTFRGEIIGGQEQLSRPDEIGEIAWVDIQEADALLPYYDGKLLPLLTNQLEIPYKDQGAL